MKTVNLERWRGRRDAVEADPAAIEFSARPARGKQSCSGCHFENQWAATCDKAVEEAVKRGLPHCDSGCVYRLVERDPRQLEIG